MTTVLSACGLLCNECDFKNQCNGCYKVKGRTFWAKEIMPNKTCPLFNCSVTERKFNSCGQCAELPCKKFTELKDPNITIEEHEKSINERIRRLK